MEVIILAGGLGTRLANIVNDVPKPMAPIANKPFLEILLDYLCANNITKVIFATAYKSEVIQKHFKEKYKNIDLSYAVANEPLGSGGQAKDGLKISTHEDVIIMNGDTFFEINLNKMMDFHKKNKSDFTMAVRKSENIKNSGSIYYNNEKQIISFKEKKDVGAGLINGGIYIVKKNIFYNINKIKFSLEHDFLEKNINNYKIMAYESNEYFIDIGTPEDYYKANNHFSVKKPALFLDRDGTLNEYGEYIYKFEDFKFNKNILNILQKFSYNEWLIFIVTNQAGIARGYYSVEDMLKLHTEVDHILKKNNIKITEWAYCPHHPDFGNFNERNCDCRKPKSGMITNIIDRYSIDINRVIMIGDKESDILCGQNAGIKSIYIDDFFKQYESILSGD